MDIFDEQAPFTEEQLEYLRTRFVSKNTAWNKLKSNVEAENIAFPVDWAKSISRQMSNTIALDFLQRLTTEGGVIVCSEACEDWELAAARSENRFFVDENNYGYVLRLER
jgi:hypothetical protein